MNYYKKIYSVGIALLLVCSLFSCGGSDTGTEIEPLLTPGNLSATPLNREVSLNWTYDNKDQEVGFKIYWGYASQTYNGTVSNQGASPILVPKGDKSLTIGGLENEVTYYFIVTSYNIYGESDPSNEVAAKPSAGGSPFLSISPYPNLNVYCNEGDGEAILGSFNVTNSGTGGAISFSAAETVNQAWLKLEPSQGVTPAQVAVKVSCFDLNANDNPTATVNFEGGGMTSQVHVNLTVNEVNAQYPIIQFEPSAINTSCPVNESISGSFIVRNIGDYNLEYSLSDNASWLTILTSTDFPLGPNSAKTIDYTINCNGFNAGDVKTAKITSSDNAPGSPHDLNVVLNINGYVIEGLSATGSGGDIIVEWQNIPGVSEYKIYYATEIFDETDLSDERVSEVITNSPTNSIYFGYGKTFVFRVKITAPYEGILSAPVWATTQSMWILDFDLASTDSSFIAIFDGVETATNYVIRYREVGSTTWLENNCPAGDPWYSQMNCEVSDQVSSGHTYEVFILAENEYGLSNPSEIKTVSIHRLAAPEPFDMTKTSTPGSSGSVDCRFTWTWSADNIDINNVIGFVFYKKINQSPDWIEVEQDSTTFSYSSTFHTKAGSVDRMYGKVRARYTGGVLGDETTVKTGVCSALY